MELHVHLVTVPKLTDVERRDWIAFFRGVADDLEARKDEQQPPETSWDFYGDPRIRRPV